MTSHFKLLVVWDVSPFPNHRPESRSIGQLYHRSSFSWLKKLDCRVEERLMDEYKEQVVLLEA